LLFPEAAWWRDDLIAELTSFPAGSHDDWCDALSMALNHQRTDVEPPMLTFVKMEAATLLVRDGTSVDAAARRVNASAAALKEWIDRKPMVGTVDDDSRCYQATAMTLVDTHRTGGYVEIDQRQYASYVRPLLRKMNDPAATTLMNELDKRFKLT
jgi:hypothetical protein